MVKAELFGFAFLLIEEDTFLENGFFFNFALKGNRTFTLLL